MTEEQPFEVLEQHDGFEVRRYPAHLVAEVTVEGSFESAGNHAFGPLAAYIFARGREGPTVAMTAPVIQRREHSGAEGVEAGEMQQIEVGPGRYVVSFVMPAGWSEETLPDPGDDRVRIRSVPEEVAAAVRYRGRWSRAGYEAKAARLLSRLAEAGLEPSGPVRFARYDPPWTPWPLRRNEVVVPVHPRDPRPERPLGHA